MITTVQDETDNYGLLDSGLGRKLERFGGFTLARPCAQALWRPTLPEAAWQAATASFDREDGHHWHGRATLPESWNITVDGMRFRLSGTDFGHLGLFPEQRENWRWLKQTITTLKQAGRSARVLNLFAYSGGSTVAVAAAGAETCHVDASDGMVQWARDNAALNNLQEAPIRWIVDDVHKFMAREIRRGRRYDGIVLDPPSFGRGARGEVYKFERDLPQTMALCREALTDTPAFVLLSAHTPGVTPTVLGHLLDDGVTGLPGRMETGEMLLTGTPGVRPTPNGCFARWQNLF